MTLTRFLCSLTSSQTGPATSRHHHLPRRKPQSILWDSLFLLVRGIPFDIMNDFAKNLIGQKFGNLTVIGRAVDSRKGRWTCKCDCGNARDFFLVNLKLGKVVTCGCQKRSRLEDLTGKRFTRLEVVCRAPDKKPGNPRWECKCDCGNTTVALTSNLKAGSVKSCGCLRIDNNYKHGHAEGGYSPEYVAWSGMKSRVTAEPPSKNYAWYKGRGIGMCERWESFSNFLADMGEKPTPRHSVDRINNDLGYSPENCRWATPSQQANNKRKSINITHQGVARSLKEWSGILGIKYGVLYWRFRKGYSPELILDSHKHGVQGERTEVST